MQMLYSDRYALLCGLEPTGYLTDRPTACVASLVSPYLSCTQYTPALSIPTRNEPQAVSTSFLALRTFAKSRGLPSAPSSKTKTHEQPLNRKNRRRYNKITSANSDP